MKSLSFSRLLPTFAKFHSSFKRDSRIGAARGGRPAKPTPVVAAVSRL
jgi:hypothetical protein